MITTTDNPLGLEVTIIDPRGEITEDTSEAITEGDYGTTNLIDFIVSLNQTYLTPASTLKSTATTATERQAMVAAIGEPVPLIYGEQTVGGKIAIMHEDSGNVYILAIWCLGMIEGVQEIYVDNENIKTDSAKHKQSYIGSTTQGIDPTLAGVIAGYADTLVVSKNGEQIGIAYSVLVFPADEVPSNLSAKVKGKIVWDTQNSVSAYSTSPALCLRDYLASNIYGYGASVNSASVTTTKIFNNQDNSPTSSQLRTLNLAIDKMAPARSHAETLRTYASCFIVPINNELHLVPDNNVGTVTETLTDSDFLDGSVKIKKDGRIEAPTVITVVWTNTTSVPWKDDRVTVMSTGVSTGDIEYRESVVRLPGITNYAQAYREAVERLNKTNFSDLHFWAVTFDETLQDTIGDVKKITHAKGLVAKEMRLMSCELISPGRWAVYYREYQASNYSSVIQTISDSPDTTVPLPGHPLAATITSCTELVETLDDGSLNTHIQIEWTAPDYPFIDEYWLKFSPPSGKAFGFTVNRDTTEFVTPPLSVMGSYTVYLSTVSNGVTASVNTSVSIDGVEDKPPTPSASSVVTRVGDRTYIYCPRTSNTVETSVKRGTSSDTYATASISFGKYASDEFSFIDTTVGADVVYFLKSVNSQDLESVSYLELVLTGGIAATDNFDWIAGELENGLEYGGTFNGSILGSATLAGTYVSTVVSQAAEGVIKNVTFYAATEPTADNTGDLWIDSDDNQLYRWSGTAWVDMQDDAIGIAQSVADAKIVTFYQDAEPDGEGEDTGDLWIDSNDGNRLWRYNGTIWVDTQDTAIVDARAVADSKIITFYQADYPAASRGDLWVDTDDNQLYICDAFACYSGGSGWVSVQDASIQTALDDAAQAILDASDAAALADSKIVTFYTSTDPTTGELGDLWIDTTNGKNKLYRCNLANCSTGDWSDVVDTDIAAALSDAAQAILDAADAYDLADEKIATFYQDSPPLASRGDLWLDTDDNQLYICDAATCYTGGSGWVTARDTEIQTALDDAAQALSDASDAAALADSKIVTFYSDADPTTGTLGDIWIDTTSGANVLHRCNLTTCTTGQWTEVQDGDIATALSDAAQAIADASDAYDLADGKIVTFYQDAFPPTGTLGDLWVDTNGGNQLYRCNAPICNLENEWVSIQDDSVGGAEVFYQSGVPEGVQNDIWIDSDNNRMYLCTGTTCDSINSGEWEEAGKTFTYAQDSAPSGYHYEIWIDTTDSKNMLYRCESPTTGVCSAIGTGAGYWNLLRDYEITTIRSNLDSPSYLSTLLESSAISIQAKSTSFLKLQSSDTEGVFIGSAGLFGKADTGGSSSPTDLHIVANDLVGYKLWANHSGCTAVTESGGRVTDWIAIDNIDTLKVVIGGTGDLKGNWQQRVGSTCTAKTAITGLPKTVYLERGTDFDNDAEDFRICYTFEYTDQTVEVYDDDEVLGTTETTFSIDAASGDVTLKGDITGSNGIFSGTVTSTTQMSVTHGAIDDFAASFTNTLGGDGVLGTCSGSGSYAVGVRGIASGAIGSGVEGWAFNDSSTCTGVIGYTGLSNAVAMKAAHTYSSGKAFEIYGRVVGDLISHGTDPAGTLGTSSLRWDGVFADEVTIDNGTTDSASALILDGGSIDFSSGNAGTINLDTGGVLPGGAGYGYLGNISLDANGQAESSPAVNLPFGYLFANEIFSFYALQKTTNATTYWDARETGYRGILKLEIVSISDNGSGGFGNDVGDIATCKYAFYTESGT